MKRLRLVLVFFAVLSVFSSCRQTTGIETEMPEDFVLLSEVVPDIILEIRYYSTYNFVGARVDGYEAPVAIMTKKAASALKEVSDELIARGYCLKVFDAY
ncbi:MAG: peptidase M15, partial [Bacteroidales bacterium]|nr:peptidase M15 [Bacteroidales bacterium]